MELYLAKPCEYCGGPMTEQVIKLPNGHAKKYCSSRCRYKAYRERTDVRYEQPEASKPRQQVA